MAALLAGADDGGVDGGELPRMLAQSLGEGRPPVDLGAQGGHQPALGRVFGLLAQGGQGALQRQAGRYQSRELARPDRQLGGAEDAACEERAPRRLARLLRCRCALHGLDAQGHQRLRAQQAACGLGAVGLHLALAGMAQCVERFKKIGGHGCVT